MICFNTYSIKQLGYMESFILQQIDVTTSDKIGNSELRDILKEYYGNNEISYTADYDSEIWGEVMSNLEKDCKLIKEIEMTSGIATIYETDVVNEFLVRFEWEKGGKNFVFWKKESTNDFCNGTVTVLLKSANPN